MVKMKCLCKQVKDEMIYQKTVKKKALVSLIFLVGDIHTPIMFTKVQNHQFFPVITNWTHTDLSPWTL